MKKSFFYPFVVLGVFTIFVFGIFQIVTVKKAGFGQLVSEDKPFTVEDIPKTGEQLPEGTTLLETGGAGTIITGPDYVESGGVLPPKEGSTDTNTSLEGSDLPTYNEYLANTNTQPGAPAAVPWTVKDPSNFRMDLYEGRPIGPDGSIPYTPPNQAPPVPPIQVPPNIPLLDSIVSSSIFGGSGQPLNNILNQLFYIGLVAAVILAIVMIIRGGLEYMTVDAINSKESGKNRVKAALGGLLLAFSAILILNTINPGLTRLNIVFPMIQSVGPVSLGGGLTSGATTQDANGNLVTTQPNGTTTVLPAGSSEAEAREYFARNGISINAAQGTTNVGGLGQAAMLGLVGLKDASGAPITITGGTEDGHQTHGVGIPIVDLRKESTLDSYITNNAVSVNSGGTYPIYTHSNGTTYMNEGDHWHVKFK